MHIEVATFPKVKPNKKQAKKILEEAAEVFGAWQTFDNAKSCAEEFAEQSGLTGVDELLICVARDLLISECADLITATCNMLHALGVDDATWAMEACKERNAERGRL